VVAHVEGDPYGFHSYGFIGENSMLEELQGGVFIGVQHNPG
jgi:hypothetical protein